MNEFILKHVRNESQMLDLGQRMAKSCKNPATIFLYGELGAGKTTLVRGFLRGFGFKEAVKSPTYTIVESYSFDTMTVHHFDFYRINDPEELEFIGIKDYFSGNAICLVEWPEKAGQLLPPTDLSCYIEPHAIGRNVKWVAHTEKGMEILKRYKNEK